MRLIDSNIDLAVFLSLNYKCNNKCLMCGVPFQKHNQYHEKTDYFLKKLEVMSPYFSPSSRIVLTGGEPLLYSDLLNLAQLIKDKYKLSLRMLSNGRMLKFKKIVDIIQQIKLEKITIAFFSYDELTFDFLAGSKGAFQDTVKGLKNLKNRNVYTEIKFIPHANNYKHIQETYLFLKDIDPNLSFTICGLQMFGEARNHVKEIGIRYKDVAIELEKFFDFVELDVKEFVPLYRFPMCTLDPYYWKYGVRTGFSERLISPDFCDDPAGQNLKKRIAKICDGCVVGCCFHHPGYEKQFGMSEFRPVRLDSKSKNVRVVHE